MKVNRVEKHRIKKSDKFYRLIDELAIKSKNLYNEGNYLIRQTYFESVKLKEEGLRDTAEWIRFNELCKRFKTEEVFKTYGSAAGQATLRRLDLTWKSFFASVKDYGKHPEKYLGRPKMPGYLDKDNGRYVVVVNNQVSKILNGVVYFSWKPLTSLNGFFKTNIPEDAKLMHIRFVPKNKEYNMEIVYEIDVPDTEHIIPKRIASIDLGVNNLLTITTNCGLEPVIINGKPLKSINQYYNKTISQMQSDLKNRNNQDYSNRMRKLTEKRNRKVADYTNKATKWFVNYCKINKIDTVVCGYSKNWKQGLDFGNVENQKIAYIPMLDIVRKLSYKLENEGILFKEQQEEYSSGTSFLDKEEVNAKNYDIERRIHRGLFISDTGIPINADVNSSYQIMLTAYPGAIKDIENAPIKPIIINLQ